VTNSTDCEEGKALILAGDVGATKILLEVGMARSDGWEPSFSRRYELADFDGLDRVMDRFLGEWDSHDHKAPRIRAAAIGAAGPAEENCIRMVHRPWTIDGTAIARQLGIPRATVVNDLAAAAAGLKWLGPNDFQTIQPGTTVEGAPSVVMGVGTGLGIAYLMGDQVIPGEGGHTGFSPATAEQTQVWEKLARKHGRVEAEEVASGRGLANIYWALHDEETTPAQITQQAFECRDPRCRNVLDLFWECLGNIAGDHALAVMARGGIFIAGGVTARIAPSINISRFRSAFCAKGAMSSLLMKIPVRAITNENLAVLGAARIASRAM
jgi:glucokinase